MNRHQRRQMQKQASSPQAHSVEQLNQLFSQATQHLEAGRFNDAEDALRRIIAVRQDSPDVYNNFGIALMRQNRFDEAALQFRQAVALKPSHADAHYNLGLSLIPQEQHDEAAACFEKALAIRPDYAEAHSDLGGVLVQQNKLIEAEAHFRKALALQPDYMKACFNLAGLKKFSAGDSDLAAFEALAAGPALPDHEKLYLHFALGKALGDVGEYGHAFDHLLQGNALKRQEIAYDEPAIMRGFRYIIDTFTPELFTRLQDAGDPSQAPIFIVGMPRSGSTLVEQILASHPQVHGAGELENLRILTGNNILDANGRPVSYPAYVSALDAASVRKLGEIYLRRLPPLPAGKTRMTDKALTNFLFIGLIRLILPNAKIIHTMRDPVDTCLSCFSSLFTTGQHFTYELGELGRYYRHYHQLMDHWRAVLPPGSMLDFSYEALVGDFEPQARRLIDYCGLPWDDNCLSFHTNTRTVTTASTLQVRQPLYKTSLQRWRPYEPYLGALLAELEGPPQGIGVSGIGNQ